MISFVYRSWEYLLLHAYWLIFTGFFCFTFLSIIPFVKWERGLGFIINTNLYLKITRLREKIYEGRCFFKWKKATEVTTFFHSFPTSEVLKTNTLSFCNNFFIPLNEACSHYKSPYKSAAVCCQVLYCTTNGSGIQTKNYEQH